MKNVAIFLKLPEITDYPLSKESYKQAYLELCEEVQKIGGDPYIVRGQRSYMGEGKFSRSWQFVDGELMESGELVADIVFDKGEFFADGKINVFNEQLVNEVCTNKWLTYSIFREFSPRSWIVRNKGELQKIDEVRTDLAVIKPIDGQEGEGVFIDKKNILREKKYTYPVLLQEFLDSSGGVPGVVEGMHDLRVAIIDGELFYSYYRTPPTGSYLANVARGGKFEVIDPSLIPQSVQDIVRKVDDFLLIAKHRFYGIDFALTPDGPKIIEMNSRLGLLPNSDHPIFHALKKKIAQILIDS